MWINWQYLLGGAGTIDKKGNPRIEFQGKPSAGLWQHKEYLIKSFKFKT